MKMYCRGASPMFFLLATSLYLLVCMRDVEAHDEDAKTTVCTTMSTIITNKNICSKMEERILALEEQVRQLQLLPRQPVPVLPGSSGIYADCEEIFHSGVTTDGVYTISPDGRCPFDVYCDMANGGWTLIQRHQQNVLSFHKDWDHYAAGFGNVRRDHWLGLDKIHRLTEKGSEIYFLLERYDGDFEHAHYNGFFVHDASTRYRMNVDPAGYEGTIPELFSYHNGIQFSTYDRDNDKYSKNCAEGGSGWWYNACFRLGLLNGIVGKNSTGGLSYWIAGSGAIYIRGVQISVKRRKGMC